MTSTTSTRSEHLTDIPGTEWRVWRDGLVRSAGFPVAMLESFAAPDCAGVADDHLAGTVDRAAFDAAFDGAAARLGAAVYAVSADPAFREAMLWQNPGALNGPQGILRDGPDAPRNERRRRREEIVAKYAQRYSGKNDTVGFFGPMCWVRMDPDIPVMTGGHGPALTRRRRAYFEWWALAAIADAIAGLPGVRPWLSVSLQPELSIRDGRLVLPLRPEEVLPPGHLGVLNRCDGRRTTSTIVLECLADPDSGITRPGEVEAVLDLYVDRKVLRREFVLPMDLSAEDRLVAQVESIAEPARAAAVDLLGRVRAAKQAVATAEGPERLAEAMDRLQAEFTAITGLAAHHRDGQTYAGRTLCHLETARDAGFTFGEAVLRALKPLDPLLYSTRWLTTELARRYRAELRRLHTDLVADTGSDRVAFDQLWTMGLGALYGAERLPDGVIEEFGRRWTKLLGLDDIAPGTTELHWSTDELGAAVRREFPADGPGWAMARLHGPDVHLCAPDVESLQRGEFSVVLGELHIGAPAMDTDFFRVGHDDPDRLRRAMAAEIAGSRVHPLLPADWPKHCARNADWMYGPDDAQLGFTPAPGADPDRLLPTTAVTVHTAPSGELVAQAPDGRSWPLLDLFVDLLAALAFDTWKLAGTDNQTPRISVDGLVLVRRTWRCTVADTGLAAVTGERERYLAVRRWATELDLPQRVFVRVGTEIKPCFVDLTSPVFTRILCTLLRGADRNGGSGTEVVITEMLPTPDQAWLTDADGNRYCSELRLHVSDPAPPVGDAG